MSNKRRNKQKSGLPKETSVDTSTEASSEVVEKEEMEADVVSTEETAPIEETSDEASSSEDEVTGSTVDTDGSPSDRAWAGTQSKLAEEVAPAAPEPPAKEDPTPEPQAGTVSTLQANPANTSTLNMLRNQLDDYIAHMGKAIPITKENGGAWQRRFYQMLERIMKLEGSVFNRAWSDLLARVLAERKGAFHENRAFRFMETSKLDNEQIRIFSNLMHLIINTADPKGRQQMLKLIDIASVTKNLPIPGASDKIQAYYLT